jgi:hypothetical protein
MAFFAAPHNLLTNPDPTHAIICPMVRFHTGANFNDTMDVFFLPPQDNGTPNPAAGRAMIEEWNEWKERVEGRVEGLGGRPGT